MATSVMRTVGSARQASGDAERGGKHGEHLEKADYWDHEFEVGDAVMNRVAHAHIVGDELGDGRPEKLSDSGGTEGKR